MSEKPQSDSGECRICPQNQFGSEVRADGTPGRAKACKNMKRMHILVEDAVLPFRLTVPPSSLRAVDNYISLITSQGLPYFAVVTGFTLKTVSNKEGIEYSELVLTQMDVIPIEKAREMKATRDKWLDVMRGQMIDSSEMGA